ncbi:DUF5362 domain-containing protein [Blastopirellula retiformator]|uniref:Uncharacterized protein n=1 Tax=Blastopirellula retiformator TaxID=2527970 RepID=A0A5C5V4G4_9BACT|nr:DUF5362 domain-containing protein [Blastopirellula retiformator]TWT32647.1 hypothetical protein Enr8_24520 [Blastopirellula retiformator]
MSDNPFASPASDQPSHSAADVDALGSLGILQPLLNIGVWAKVLAISMILLGIGFVMSIVGIVVGWLPIWAGVLLWQHSTQIAEAQRLQDSRMLRESIEKLATSIKLAAIF